VNNGSGAAPPQHRHELNQAVRPREGAADEVLLVRDSQRAVDLPRTDCGSGR
jgi:hypothetical protein